MAQWKKVIISGSNAELNQVAVGSNLITTSSAATKLSGSFSGSFQGDGSALTGIASTLYFSGSNGSSSSISLKEEGLLLSSSANNLVVDVSSSIVHIDLADRVIVSHLEATTISGSVSGSFNGNLAADSGYLSGSFAGSGSGDFSGSFKGDGSQLTGVVAEWDGTHVGTGIISGSLIVSGGVVDLTNATAISGSTFSGSFVGDGSGLTGVTAEWDGTHVGTGIISGSLIVSGGVVDFTNATAISGSVFSGSFVGDGSGLTGIASTLAFSGSEGSSGSISLKEQGLQVTSSDNNIVANASASVLQLSLATNIVHSGSISGSSLLTVESGSFQAITTPHLVVNSLTASYALKAETEAINSGISQHITSASTTWTIQHGLNTAHPIVEVWDDATNTVIIPAEVKSLSVNTVQITFDVPTTGYVNVSRAGHIYSASFDNMGTSLQVTPASDTWTITHNLGTDYPIVEVWDNNRQVIGPDNITSVDENTVVVTFTQAVEGWINISRAGHIVTGSSLWTSLSGPANVTASLNINGTLTANGIVDFTASPAISGSVFSGSFVGDGSGLTGLVAEWDGTHVGTGIISGSLIVSGGVVDFTNATTISGSTFSGSFVGDGSGLTGIASTLFFTGSNGTSSSLNLKDSGLVVSSSDNNLVTDATGNVLDISLSDTLSASGSFSGSFEGDGSKLTGIVSASYASTASYVNTLTQNVRVEGDILATGNIIAQQYVVSSSVSHITESFSSGSTIFGDTTDDTHLVIGSLIASGAKVDFTDTPAISGSIFSGSFVGDGSGLTGLVSSLAFSGSNGTSSSINLKEQGLFISSSDNNIIANATANKVEVALADRITVGHIEATTLSGSLSGSFNGNLAADSGYLSGSFAGSGSGDFSGSFKGDGSQLTGLVTVLNFSGSAGTGSIDLKSAALNLVTGSKDQLFITASGDTVTFSISDTAEITGSLSGTFEGSGSGAFSGSFKGDGSGLTGVTAEWDGTHVGTGIISGSLIVSGGVVDFTDATAISGSVFSGSFVGDGSGLTGLVTELGFTGSIGSGSVDLKSQDLSFNIGTKDQLVISGSGQGLTFTISDTAEISGSFSGSSEGTFTGDVAGTSGYLSGSFAGSGSGAFSGSFKGDGSQLTGVIAEWDGTHSGSGVISGSLLVSGGIVDFTNTPAISGSVFSGSFVGDGSGLTGLVTVLNFSGSAGTGSIDLKTGTLNLVTGSKDQLFITASGDTLTFSISDTAEISGSFSGSFQGDGSGLTGVTAEWDGTHSGSGVISGSLLVSGGIVDFTNTPAISGSIFSGSFVGDGSGLTGISSSLFITSSGTNKIFNLSTETLSITGSANEVITSFNTSSNTLQFGLADNVIVSGSLTVGGNFTVFGETTTLETTNLVIEDRWALFASGANSEYDGGIIIQSASNQSGYSLGVDASAQRWALQKGMFDTSTGSIAPDAYLATAQWGLEANIPDAPSYGTPGNQYGNIWVSTDTGEVYIYS